MDLSEVEIKMEPFKSEQIISFSYHLPVISSREEENCVMRLMWLLGFVLTFV
jgi:hypothetical protein